MLLKIFAILILVCSSFFMVNGCKLSDKPFPNENELHSEIPIQVAKWYDDHKAAISIMLDDGAPHLFHNPNIQDMVLQNKLVLEYELVTDQLQEDSAKLSYIYNFMMPNGIKLFGHGNKHENHDKYSYDEALQSFKLCFNIMKSIGLKPVSYAYPGGYGYLFRTRRALKESGFLSGRRFEQLDLKDPYIMPDSTYEPRDWFGLPCLVMQSINYDGCVAAINNTAELIPFLKNSIEKTAWIILTYHAVGLNEGYGFYELPDFEKDILAIKSFDFWCASSNDITLYCYERNKAKVKASIKKDENDIIEYITIQLSDNLPNDYYDHPLTLKFQIPELWINRELALIKGNTRIGEFQFNSKEAKVSVVPDESTYILKLR